MKIMKKIGFWMITCLLAMFVTVISIATASRMHIGQKFNEAFIGAWEDTTDGIGELIGIQTRTKPDWIGNFKNGTVGFENTHISW